MLRGSGRARRILLAAPACAAALAGFPAGAGSAGECGASVAAQQRLPRPAALSRALRCLVNEQRLARGLPRLKPSRLLGRAARAHAGDMVARHYFSHVTPEGATVGQRLRRAGYPRRELGEAIGYATGDRAAAARLYTTFMASPEHRQLLLGAGFDRVGVGVAAGWPIDGRRGTGVTVVVDLGRSRPAR